jgi:hypothetical protein
LKYLPRVLLYYVKFIAFEPFRLVERALYGEKLRTYRFSEDPIFILGYYRSGTTHLQEVLLQDPQYGYMNFFQCYFTNAFLVTERACKTLFQKIMTAVRFDHPAHRVPFRFDMPGEEDVAMVASGVRCAANWGQVYPRSFRHLFDKYVYFETATPEERQEFEGEMLDLLKRVALANGNKRLLLKSPPQTGRLAMLKSLFPRAKFIYIRRNPYLVYKSNLRLWSSFHAQCLQDFTVDQAREAVLWSFDKCLEFYERDKVALAENDLYEIAYEDFMKDPMGNLEAIYRKLELPGYPAAEPRFRTYLERKHGQNIDRHEFSPDDFEAIESRWKRWVEQGRYERPSSTKPSVSSPAP